MKLVMVSYRFEYNEPMERILGSHGLRDYIRISQAQGSDQDGKHDGSKIYPGHMAQVWAQVQDDDVDDLLRDIEEFKNDKQSHEHVTALVLGVEKSI
ncbi:MAG: PG0541 family transporter-associated protein [Oceanidesulfovibrio sp.]